MIILFLASNGTAWKLAPHSSAPHSSLIRLRTANYIHCLAGIHRCMNEYTV